MSSIFTAIAIVAAGFVCAFILCEWAARRWSETRRNDDSLTG
jgi:hypothetical protein